MLGGYSLSCKIKKLFYFSMPGYIIFKEKDMESLISGFRR